MNSTVWPALMMAAFFSWMAVFSLSGFICTIVATGVFSRMNSPGWTRRSETEPLTGALIDGVIQFLLGELIGRAPILQARLEAAHVVDRGLVVRLRDLQTGFGCVAVGLGQETAAVQLLRAFERGSRVVAVRHRLADRGDLIVGRRLLVLRPVDAQLCLDLAQRALGALEGQRQLPRLEPHQHVADADLAPELDPHLADDAGDLAADARLVGRHQRAGQVHAALDADVLKRRRSRRGWPVHRHGHRVRRRGLPLRPSAPPWYCTPTRPRQYRRA